MNDDLPDDIRDGLDSRPPRDVVPPRGLDRRALLALNANTGLVVYLHRLGEVIEDVDGIPSAVAPTTIEPATLAAPIVTEVILRRAGVDRSEVPNLHIIEPKETT